MIGLAKSLASQAFDWTSEDFFETFGVADGSLLQQETDLWDYKLDWPFSYSDEYFAHLAKLISAFANTSGGLVIFGVVDDTRRTKVSSVRINVDRLAQALGNNLSIVPKLIHRNFSSDKFGNVDVLAVCPLGHAELPAYFTKSLSGVVAGSMWVRVGHENIQASPRHIPLLFCRSGLGDKTRPPESSLPPSPSTIKQFIGRLDTIYEVFAWLYNSRQPRNFLYGKGGSGKTAIAYEIAKYISEFGNSVYLTANRSVENVIFVSAKEKALNVLEGISTPFLGRDFSNERELYEAILILGGWTTSDDLKSWSKEQLLEGLEQFFDVSSSFIVIDDVDTLTTQGRDAGLENMYLALARAKSPNKILYTLRNAPTHSLANSVEVPGLSDVEYDVFIDACSQQFKVIAPSQAVRATRLKEVSERRPLVIESIIALRRNTATYEQAVQLFEQHAGESARDYVFKREWDALPADNRARYLLAALSLLDQQCTIEDLTAVLQYNDELVAEAVGSAREMFLEISEADGETSFQLGALTRAFVLAESKRLDRIDTLSARVDAFRKSIYPENAALSRLRLKTDRLIRSAMTTNSIGDLNRAWTAIADPSLPPTISEDPRYRAYLGYVAAKMTPPLLSEARDAFTYAFAMKFEPDVEFLRPWYYAETQSGHGGEYCEKIVNFITRGKTYSQQIKIEFTINGASRLYALGKDIRYSDPTKAISMLRQSLLTHLRTLRLAISVSHPQIVRIEEYARNTAFLLFNTFVSSDMYDDLFEVALEMTKVSDLFLDPLELPLIEYCTPLASRRFPVRTLHRYKGKLGDLIRRLTAAAAWENDRVKASTVSSLNKISERMQSAL